MTAKLPLDQLSMRQLMSLDACTRCGECQKWCPIYTLENKEDVTPRSKIKALKEILKAQGPGFLGIKPKLDPEVAAGFTKSLYDCSCCNQCHFVCPARIDTVELWENIRESVFVAGEGPAAEPMAYCETLKTYGNPYKKDSAAKTDWISTGLANGTLRQQPELISENKAEVLLFLGCTATFDEKINLVAQYAINILTAAGVKFGIMGTDEFCCYGKLRRIGDPEFRDIARANIDSLNKLGIKTLVTACSGCFKTLKQDYDKIGKQNHQIYHLAEYVDMLMAEGKIKLNVPIPGKITYHDPCLLGRHNGIYDAPRRIIGAISSLELLEMERNRQYSRCCGVGGGLKMANHDLQEAASVYRIREAEATGAKYLTTPCPTCFSGLAGGADKAGSPIIVRHLAELVQESMGI